MPSYRILLVEESEDDYLLVRGLLGDIATIQFDLHRADNCRDARDLLSCQQFSVCLLGFGLGEYSGLWLMREFRGSETPFILLAGTDEHEVDVAAAQAGASDVLIKGSLSAPILERSIRYAIQRKDGEAALLQAQSFAQGMADALPNSIAVLDSQGVVVALNAAWRGDADSNGSNGFVGAASGVGSNYLEACEASDAANGRAAEGIRAVIDGREEDFYLEYSGRNSGGAQWFQMSVRRFPGGSPLYTVVSHEDITARKRAEHQLFIHSHLLDVVGQAVVVTDSSGIITYWNAFAEKLYGWPGEEAVGRNVLDVTPSAATRQQASEIMARMSRGESWDGEFVVQRRDGTLFPAYVTNTPVLDEEGRVASIIGLSLDLTERIDAEERLRQSEASLAKAQQVAGLGSWEMDLLSTDNFGANPLRWSEEVFRILGYEPEQIEVSYENFFRAVHPDDINRLAEVVAQSVRERRALSIDHRILLPDGRERIVHEQVEVVLDLCTVKPLKIVGTVQDITERKRAEAALRESEERFGSIVANVPGIVYQFVMQPDGTIEWPFISEGSRDIYEEEPQVLRDSPLWFLDRIHPEDRLEFERSIQASAQALAPWRYEGRHVLPSGKVRWLQGTSRPQRLPGGGTLWNGLVIDITARKEAEEERDRFFTLSLDLLCIVDLSGHFNRLNPAFETALGFPASTLMAVPFLDWVHPDDREATVAAMEKLRGGEVLLEFVNRYRCRDGSYRWLSWVAAPFGGLAYAAAHDITSLKKAEAALHKANDELELRVMERTWEMVRSNEQLQEELAERKRAEETLRAAQQMLRLVIDNIPQGIFWKDRRCAYMGANNRLAQDAGLGSPQEMIGKNCYDMPWADLAAAYQADDREVMETDVPKMGIPERIIKADGTVVWLLTNKIPLHDARGNVMGVLGSYEDITAQREAEAAIRQARDEAERANKAKSEFLSRMSHELRTPLNAILGFGQILEMHASEPRQLGNIQQILKAGRHLLGLINEVLDISRIETGHLALSMEPTGAGLVVREILDLVQPLAAARGIHLVNEVVDGSLGRHLMADQQRLKQVLLNLLSNAVKYNREGGSVFVSCQVISGAPMLHEGLAEGVQEGIGHEGQLRFLVRDTGEGLSPEDISKLFVPFERLGAAHSQIEGTGIGLTLCKRLVEAMNGRIGVESEVGQGSTFWIELPLVSSPLEPGAEPTDGQLSTPDGAGGEGRGTILCIEDNLSNINLIGQALLSQRYNVRFLTAMQGSVGLELAAQHLPDLILLDVHLPDIMGDAVLRRLKADASTRGIPVIVLSADATAAQAQRLLAGGAQAYLTKPLDLKRFFEVVEQVLRKDA